jgi:hypothetical protein
MRVAQALLIAVLGLSLTGCVLRKPKTAKAAPPVPAPAPAPAPAPPPEPVSVPQTTVHLPPLQPLTPEAIATTQPAGEPAPAPVTAPRTPPPRTPRPTRNSEPPPVATPPPVTPPAVEPGRAPFTEVLPAAEQKRLQDEAAQRIQEARNLVAKIPRARRQHDTTVKRVEAFLQQAEEASRRGDVRQASELAGRALVLARDLKP